MGFHCTDARCNKKARESEWISNNEKTGFYAYHRKQKPFNHLSVCILLFKQFIQYIENEKIKQTEKKNYPQQDWARLFSLLCQYYVNEL